MALIWNQVSTPAAVSPAMKVSESGQYVVLVETGYAAPKLYISSNYGATFTTSFTDVNFQVNGFDISRSGQQIVLVGAYINTYPTPIENIVYVSTDYGVTWSVNLAPDSLTNIPECCAFHPYDGTLFMAAVSGQVYKSVDDGKSWSLIANLTDTLWAISVSNNTICILSSTRCYISDNNGYTFTQQNLQNFGAQPYYQPANTDTTILFPSSSTNPYISYNKGQTWTMLTSIYARSASMSGNGKIQLLTPAGGDGVYVSFDYGVSFGLTEIERSWFYGSVSYDGSKLYLIYQADQDGSVLLSADAPNMAPIPRPITYRETNQDRLQLIKANPCPCSDDAGETVTSGELTLRRKFAQSCCSYYIVSNASSTGLTSGSYYVLQGGISKGKPTLYQAISDTELVIVFQGQYTSPPSDPIEVISVDDPGETFQISTNILAICPCPSYN